MSELRKHSEIHPSPNISGNVYKNADMSSLMCNLCSQKCTNLTELVDHLKSAHAIEFPSISHIFIPYKLQDGFSCVICDAKFNAFLRLSTHMNTHSTNHVCETCGLRFFNTLNLRTHRAFQHRFSKRCTICGEQFNNQYVQIKHMKTAHKKSHSYKRHCVLCDETFKYAYLLQEHKIQNHGAKRPISKCSECGKTFLTPQNLKIHTRSVHIMERNFVCDVCGVGFFTKSDHVRHQKRHADVKLFSCGNCDAQFKAKDSWVRHQRKKHHFLLELD